MVNRLRKYYLIHLKSKFLSTPVKSRHSGIDPFFILSSGRSGSTLLRKILLRSNAVNIPPESNDFIPKVTKHFLEYNSKSWDNLIDEVKRIFESTKGIGYWDLHIEKNDLCYLKNEMIDKSLHGIISYIYYKYGQKYAEQAILWGDKTPYLMDKFDWLNLLFPNAKYIYMIRDGRDVVCSYLEARPDYNIEKAANRWLASISHGKQIKRRVGPGRFYSLKYEDLTSDPESSLRYICAFLKIPYNPEILKNTPVFLGDDSQPHHVHLNKDINTNSIGRWKYKLTSDEKKYLEKLLILDLKEQGYVNSDNKRNT